MSLFRSAAAATAALKCLCASTVNVSKLTLRVSRTETPRSSAGAGVEIGTEVGAEDWIADVLGIGVDEEEAC